MVLIKGLLGQIGWPYLSPPHGAAGRPGSSQRQVQSCPTDGPRPPHLFVLGLNCFALHGDYSSRCFPVHLLPNSNMSQMWDLMTILDIAPNMAREPKTGARLSRALGRAGNGRRGKGVSESPQRPREGLE